MPPLDLTNIDTTTLPAGPETDAKMAREWMGWRQHFGLWFDADGPTGYGYTEAAMIRWSPSTNPAHAVEALVKVRFWRVETGETRVYANIYDDEGKLLADGECLFTETNDNELEAMALAITRACLATAKAKKDRG